MADKEKNNTPKKYKSNTIKKDSKFLSVPFPDISLTQTRVLYYKSKRYLLYEPLTYRIQM